MSEENEIQRVQVDIGMGGEPPKHFCPVCGTEFLSGGELNACPHLKYFYADVADGFVYLAPELGEAEYPKHEDDDEWDGTRIMRQKLQEQSKNPRVIIEFMVQHGGMACGPIFCTDIYCIEFGR
jgi:hypothetical protein